MAQVADATETSPPQTAERNLRAMVVLHGLGRRVDCSKAVAGLIRVKHSAISGWDFSLTRSL